MDNLYPKGHEKVINKKDEKILLELISNSRIPVNQLAKKVGLSREVVNYRLKNLTKQKVIKQFYAIINPESLGFSKSGCFFQLKGISKQKEKEFLNYLVKHEFVSYVSPIIGKWNFIFDILFKTKEQLSKVIQEIKNKFGKNMDNFIILSNNVEQEIFQKKILGKTKLNQVQKIEKRKTDKIDLQILFLLSENSRIEYKQISSKLKLTANAIKARIKNLESSNIILSYTISIDIRKLNYSWYNLQIKEINTNDLELKKFLRENKKVIYFYKYLGNENWDIDIGLIIKDPEELREFILDIREKFGNTIKIHDLYIIVEESKSNALPEGVFENP